MYLAQFIDPINKVYLPRVLGFAALHSDVDLSEIISHVSICWLVIVLTKQSLSFWTLYLNFSSLQQQFYIAMSTER